MGDETEIEHNKGHSNDNGLVESTNGVVIRKHVRASLDTFLIVIYPQSASEDLRSLVCSFPV